MTGADRGEARAARDAGIQQAANNANDQVPRWTDRAFDILLDYMTIGRIACGGEFSAEDVRAHADLLGLTEPPHLRAWGAVFQRAARRGLIERAGTGQARAAHVHCSVINLWRVPGRPSILHQSREQRLEGLLSAILDKVQGHAGNGSGLRELVDLARAELSHGGQ